MSVCAKFLYWSCYICPDSIFTKEKLWATFSVYHRFHLPQGHGGGELCGLSTVPSFTNIIFCLVSAPLCIVNFLPISQKLGSVKTDTVYLESTPLLATREDGTFLFLYIVMVSLFLVNREKVSQLDSIEVSKSWRLRTVPVFRFIWTFTVPRSHCPGLGPLHRGVSVDAIFSSFSVTMKCAIMRGSTMKLLREHDWNRWESFAQCLQC